MSAAPPDADPSAGAFDADELSSYLADLARYPRIALAVSGGADSVALMLLVRCWADLCAGGPDITVLTVDHRLREASTAEAGWVEAQAAALGFGHKILVWEGDKPHSAIQAEARRARYGLMTAFCRAANIPVIATAHTLEDQAETVLMRLARGSGLDGLSAMDRLTWRDGVDILRPLLAVSRRRIEVFLSARGQPWLADPSNADERYERVRIRRTLEAAQSLGLAPAALALSARRLRRARDALDQAANAFLRAHCSLHKAGFATLSLAALCAAHEEIGLRAITRIIAAVGGSGDPVRLSKIEACYASLRTTPRDTTLGGCRLVAKAGSLAVFRELGRMREPSAIVLRPGETVQWDGRFTVTYAESGAGAATLRALGTQGLKRVKAGGGHFGQVPRLAVITLPSLWIGDTLSYVPFAEFAAGAPEGWSAASSADFLGILATGGLDGRPVQADL